MGRSPILWASCRFAYKTFDFGLFVGKAQKYTDATYDLMLKMEAFHSEIGLLELATNNFTQKSEAHVSRLNKAIEIFKQEGRFDSAFDAAHLIGASGGQVIANYLIRNLDRKSSFFENDLRIISLIEADLLYSQSISKIDSLKKEIALIERKRGMLWNGFERPSLLLFYVFLFGLVVFIIGMHAWYSKKQKYDDIIILGKSKEYS